MLLLLALACTPADTDPIAPTDGEVLLLTYNVAGLPEGLSSSHPEANHPQISPLLNAYDLVLVQEDFAYHDLLAAEVDLPYASEPAVASEAFMADGLNRFSRSPFRDHQRVRWVACNGVTDGASDCLAEKGFAVARHELAPGVELAVVNLHADAGGGPEDEAARAAGFAQLAEWLDAELGDAPVLVAGDTNLHRESDPEDAVVSDDFIAATGLTDLCDATGCAEGDHIDRVLFRSGPGLDLAGLTWEVAEEFVDAAGEPLSDHPAIRGTIRWSVP